MALLVALMAAAVLTVIWLTADSRNRQAVHRAVATGRWSEAQTLIAPLLKRHPDDPELRVWMARIAAGRSQFAQALSYLEDVPSLGPWGEESLFRTAEILLRLHQADRAEQTARNAIRLYPASTKAREQLVDLFHLERRLLEAKELLWELYELAPAPDRIHVLAKMFRVDFGTASESDSEVLNALLRESPSDPDVLVAVADNIMLDGHLDRARDLLESAIASFPEHAAVRVTLAECFYQLGELEQSDAMLRGIPEQLQSPLYWRLAGVLHHELHESLDQAIACFRSALAIQADDWNTRHRLALVLVAAGRTDEADDEFAHVERARQLLDGERLTRLLNEVVTRVASTDNRLEIAQHYGDLGMFRECRAWCVAVLDLEPSQPTAQKLLAELSAHNRTWRDQKTD